MQEISNTNSTINIQVDNKKDNPYYWGLDLIRIIAMFFVILVHSTSFYGFTSTNVNTFLLFIFGMGRYLSFTCVPLFLVLTGYLSHSKTPSKKYYFKIIKILIEYVLCGITVAIINKYCFDSPDTFGQIASKILTFGFPSYSWYINMYVGLFLMTPFLNYGYNAIPNKYKWGFLISLLLICSNPAVSTYWFVSYPIMYYFIGLFLKDKQFKANKLALIGVILMVCIIQTLLFMYPVIPLYNVENHNNIGCVVLTVAIFLLFYDLRRVNMSKLKTTLCGILRIIANASLSTFLLSVIFESFTSKLFNKLSLTTFIDRLPYLAYLTPLKFVLSVLCGIIISIIATFIFKLLNIIIGCIKRKILQNKSKKI